MVNASFGTFAKRLRTEKGLGLRQAAKLMGISAAYLSQIERDIDEPTTRVMAAMSKHYDCPLGEIEAAVTNAGVEYRIPQSQRSIEELQALYRLGGGTFTSGEVEGMIRHLLEVRGEDNEEIERLLALLRAELPRRNDSEREGLFAADIKPRFLSKREIAKTAYSILARNAAGPDDYTPPTLIEQIVESEPGISCVIADLSAGGRDNVIMGRTRWSGKVREIAISAELADSSRECDRHRFRFTLGHEYFHAIEHLRLPDSKAGHLPRSIKMHPGFAEYRRPRGLSRAEAAVARWAKDGTNRGLLTREDWREWQANTFASAILMPEWAVTKELAQRVGSAGVVERPDKNPRELAIAIASEHVFSEDLYEKSLAELFDVSRQAMAIRLLDLGLVQEVAA